MEMQDLDPKLRNGRFRVRTTNTEYIIVASKRVSGQVKVEGGQYFPTPADAIIGGRPRPGEVQRSGVIKVGDPMILGNDSHDNIRTSPVVRIERL